MALFAIILTLGQTAYATIAATFLMAYTGSWLLIMIQATLADKHPTQRTIALTEANTIASIGATLAPALIGFAAYQGFGWRGVLYSGIFICIAMFIFFRKAIFPDKIGDNSAEAKPSGKLPSRFWVYWFIALLVGSIEWSVVFWCADFLEKVVGLTKADASTAVSAYFLANVIGRTLGSRLSRSMSTETLLFSAVVVSSIGFPIFWLAPSAAISVFGLFVAGLGISNLFPFVLAAATRAAPDQSNTASARVSMAMGISSLVTPQILALVADQIGIQRAYTIVIILLIVVLGVVFMTNRMTQREIVKNSA
jgi:fucose permease